MREKKEDTFIQIPYIDSIYDRKQLFNQQIFPTIEENNECHNVHTKLSLQIALSIMFYDIVDTIIIEIKHSIVFKGIFIHSNS